MSLIQQTDIWIKRSILLEAAKLAGETIRKSENDDDWDWCRAVLVKGNITLQDDITLQVEDEDLFSSPTLLLIPKEMIMKKTKSPLMSFINNLSTERDIKGEDSSKNVNNSEMKPRRRSKFFGTSEESQSNDSSKFIVLANSFTESNDFLPPDNLMSLTHLHEPALVHSLNKRFERGHIHTYTGDILLIVNPFQQFDELYDYATLSMYMKQGDLKNNTNSENLLPPHVFAFADKAYRQMIEKVTMSKTSPKINCDQCILVSGESGAGKTVTTKHIMKYLSSLSRNKNGSNSSPLPLRQSKRIVLSISRSQSIRSSFRMSRLTNEQKSEVIEQKILESNPILESFGNARTVRNDNSSRFGKFIELQFEGSGALVGAEIDTYLLEKVRLVNQGEGERNYHIFYEMLSAVDSEDRQMFFLENFTAEDFRLTNQSGIYDRRDKVDDLEQFDILVLSMNKTGFNYDQQQHFFSIISALLHASNVSFSVSSSDESKVDYDNLHLKYVTDLLGLDVDSFNDALCAVYIEVGKERHRKNQPKDKAEKGLEALAKAIYSALFNHIVEEINTSIACKKRGKDGVVSFIGVLDIFGFESFKINSLEQLFINYCNEALQEQFNAFVFRSEQDIYRREGIDWSIIEFPDNKDVLDLIESKRTGLISVLDDQCRTPGTTDKTFASLLYQTCKNHARFEADFRQVAMKQFGIKHSAGTVEYDTINFIEKNRDETPRETIELLKSSSKPFLHTLLRNIKKSTATSSMSNKFFKSTQITAGCQFKTQLQSLRQKIDKTTPHYVRCLKPNNDLIAGEFNSNMISAQLQSVGVLEAIRISRVGFSQRFSHDQFLERYELLDMDKMIVAKRKKVSTKHRCEMLLKSFSSSIFDNLEMSIHGIQLGRTKIFLCQKHFDQLEYHRENKMTTSVVSLQSQARRLISRSYYLRAIAATVIIQNFMRKIFAVKLVQSMRWEKSSILIQSIIRRRLAIKLVKLIQQNRSSILIALWCQRFYRGKIIRKNYSFASVKTSGLLVDNDNNITRGVSAVDTSVNNNFVCQNGNEDTTNRIDKNILYSTLDVAEVPAGFGGKDQQSQELASANEALNKESYQLQIFSVEESRILTERLERVQLELKEQSHQRQLLSIILEEKDKELKNITVENEILKQQINLSRESSKKEKMSMTEELEKLQLDLKEQSHQCQELSKGFEEKQKELERIEFENESLRQKNIQLLNSDIVGSQAPQQKVGFLNRILCTNSHAKIDRQKDHP